MANQLKRRSRESIWALIALLGMGCGDSGGAGDTGSGGANGIAAGSGSGAGGVDAGAGGSTQTTGGGMKPPPGPSGDGWESDYVDGGAGVNCDDDEAAMVDAGAASLTFSGTTLYVGFQQDGNNQNPVFARFDDGEKVYCVHHETEGPDGRALGVTWDGGEFAYVVYTIVGGGSALEGHGGWLDAYAPGSISGGGSKVSVVGRVGTSDGALDSATFVIAVKSDNKVNSHSPTAPITVLESGQVEFLGASAHKPIDVDKEAMDCTDYPFDSRYRFTADLSEIVCADCSNCSAKSPCRSP